MRFLSSKIYSPKQQRATSSTMPTPAPTPAKSTPVVAQHAGGDFIVGGGVAIFHIATSRVVICSAENRRGETYYFLPKGRRDAGEESGTGAEREGYEEVRYADCEPHTNLLSNYEVVQKEEIGCRNDAC
jgi:hypothetical protein